MIDLSGLTLPDGAPGEGVCVRIERPEPGLAVLVLDPPHRKLAVLDLPLLRDLDLALDRIDGEIGLRGIVITGRSPAAFAAGADIEALADVRDEALVRRLIGIGHALFARVEALRPRTVAAVGGPVLGGAYELALACDRIVAADAPATRIGLPETQLGILPAWGGSTRLPRRIGPALALEAILQGRLFSARDARKRGMVDRVTQPEDLLRIAADIALGRERSARRSRRLAGILVDRNPLATRMIAGAARRQVLARTHGHYPAPLAAIDIVARAAHTAPARSFAAEAEAGARLAVSDTCKNLIGIFQGTERAKKLKNLADGTPAPDFARAGVLGAGVMGGGIASLCAEKGLSARLFDVAPAALDAALIVHRGEIAKLAARRRVAPNEALLAGDRMEVTRELAGFARCDVAIEAVAEKLAIKRDVLGKLAAEVGADAVIATNTSSLSVEAIAEGLPHPERFAGMHFFNPVRKMPLVEIVRGRATDARTVARIAALALRLGKTPVVVADKAGFLVNRLLGPYLDEALRLFAGGIDPARIDRVALRFGMPMGPLALLDEVGFDVATHASASLLAAYGARMSPCTVLEPFVHAGRLGKKSGSGFYVHPREAKGKRPKAPVLASDLARFVPARPTAAAALGDDDIEGRLLLAMLNEAAHAMEDAIVASAADLDLATVFGMGFPPFRGGVLRWCDALGQAAVVERLAKIAAAPDVAGREGGAERFTPAPALAAMAREGRRWYDKGRA